MSDLLERAFPHDDGFDEFAEKLYFTLGDGVSGGTSAVKQYYELIAGGTTLPEVARDLVIELKNKEKVSTVSQVHIFPRESSHEMPPYNPTLAILPSIGRVAAIKSFFVRNFFK